MAARDEHPASLALGDLGLALGDDLVVGAHVALGAEVLEVHPGRVAEARGGLAVGVDHPERLEERPHRVVDLVAELVAHPHVVLIGRGEVREHRVVLGRQPHEVGGVDRHDLIDAPVEVVEVHLHVQRGADVEADGQAVQLAHHRVLEAAAHQLLARAEHLGADEAGHVVEVHPRGHGVAGRRLGLGHLLGQRAREAVLARLVHHHVEAVAVAVGRVGTLAGLEVEPELAAAPGGVGEHLVDRHVERGVGVVGGAQALEPQRGGAGELVLDRGLHVDVREHAVGHGVLQAEGDQHVLQRELHRGHGVDLARDGVGAQHHVADRVGPAREHLPHDVVGVVGGRIGLDAGAHVAARADGGARQGVEHLAARGDELLVGHELDDHADHLARQARHHGLDRDLVLLEQEIAQLAHRPAFHLREGVGVDRGLDEIEHCVLVQRVRPQVADHRVGEQRPRIVAGALVERVDAERLVALLVLVGGPDDGLVECLVVPPADAADVLEHVLALANGGDRHAAQRGGLVVVATAHGHQRGAAEHRAEERAAAEGRRAAAEPHRAGARAGSEGQGLRHGQILQRISDTLMLIS